MNVLQVKDLFVTIDRRRLLVDLSFDVESGERLIIIGPNGAGKTLMLKALLGLVPHTGEIKWSPDVRIGYVPQKIDADRHLPITYRDLFTSKAAVVKQSIESVVEVCKNVGLSPRLLDTPVGHLSGGQFQLGLIAFALIGKPNVLILDEPTASVDEPGEEHIYGLIYRLQHDYDLAVIAVTHDMSFVYHHATKVLCLNKRSVCLGKPEVLTQEILEELYGESLDYYRHDHHEQLRNVQETNNQ